MPKSDTTFCFFGHPKCAGTWFSGVLIGIANEMGQKTLQKQLTLMANPAEEINKHKINFLLSQNTSYEKVKLLNNYKGVHIVRDPREMTSSAYFSYRNTHEIREWKELGELREKLTSQSKEEGLKTLILWNKEFLAHLESWNYNDPNILELKVEDLTENPEDSITQILQFWGFYNPKKSTPFFFIKGLLNRICKKAGLPFLFTQVNISSKDIKRIHSRVSFVKLSKGRNTGETSNKSHYRNGKTGDWKNHFNDEHKDLFKSLHQDLIEKLGYETNSNW